MGDNIWENIQHILSWMQECSFIWNNDRVHLTPAHENNLAEVRFIIQGTSLLFAPAALRPGNTSRTERLGADTKIQAGV